MRLRFTGFAVITAIAMLLAGCSVGPDFLRPAPPKDAGYAPTPLPKATAAAAVQGGDAQRFIAGGDIRFDWWTAFQSPALDALVERAIRANPTIEAAQRALAAAEENVYAQQGFFFPTVGVGYQFQRQMVAGNLANSVAPGVQGNGRDIAAFQNPTGEPHNKALYYNLPYRAGDGGLHAGRVRPQPAAGRNRWRRRKPCSASSSRPPTSRSPPTSSPPPSRKLRCARRSPRSRRSSPSTSNRSTCCGRSSRTAMPWASSLRRRRRRWRRQGSCCRRCRASSSRRGISSARWSALCPTRMSARLRSRLAAPAAAAAAQHPLEARQQRPDVRAAEEQLRAANAQVGVAIANRLPLFSITAAAGGTATEFDRSSPPAVRSGASSARSRSRSSTAARCVTASAPRTRRSTRRRRNTAAPSSPPIRTWRIR